MREMLRKEYEVDENYGWSGYFYRVSGIGGLYTVVKQYAGFE